MSVTDALGLALCVAIPLVIIRAALWWDARHAPRSAPQNYRHDVETSPVVHHVHHIDWAEAPPDYSPPRVDELTPAARALIERGGR